jgi:uncharacterized protein
MAVSAAIADIAFGAFNLAPSPSADIRERLTHFSLNYTFWLNLAFGAAGLYLWHISRRSARRHDHDSR